MADRFDSFLSPKQHSKEYLMKVLFLFFYLQEYPYQLVKIADKERLARCLTEWPVFDRLYEEDYSTQLLAYWRKVNVT